MKLLIFALGILLYQAPNVSSFHFFEFLRESFTSVANAVVSTFRELGDRIRHALHRKNYRRTAVTSQPLPNRVKLFSTTDRSAMDLYTPFYERLQMEASSLLSTPQLAALHGKKVESHVIITKDGYLLTLHRVGIDRVDSENASDTKTGTVLLHHGLLGSSSDWILLGPEKSLPYILSNVGYDVWMINARGSYYSRGHIELKVDCDEYWDFSFHEIGLFDISATVDYIRKIKNSTEQINFVGHSMGASALLVLLSTKPRYNEYFRIAVFLGPLVFMMNTKGPMRAIPGLPKIASDENKGKGEFMPHRKIPCSLAKEYCVGPKIYCSNSLFFLSGIPDYAGWNESFINRVISHVPGGGSMKTVVHYEQLAATGKFHRFGNMQAAYPLPEVTVPIAMFSSSEDWLAPVPDVLKLFFTIKVPVDHYVINGENVSHTDFVYGTKAHKIVFPRLLEYLENGLNFTSTFRNEV